MFYVYIIESLSSGKWYYGFTSEPEQRLEAHNKGLNKSTSGRGPWKYIFKEHLQQSSKLKSLKPILRKPETKFTSVINLLNSLFETRVYPDKSGPVSAPR